jgi:hypothetical protein
MVGLDSGKATLQINQLWGQSKTIPMVRQSAVDFMATIPAELVVPGQLQYRIILQKGNDFSVFPGDWKGDPYAWDNHKFETWKTFVANENGSLELFNPTTDRTARSFPVWRRGFQTNYITGEKPGQLILRMTTSEMGNVKAMGFQFACIDKLKGRLGEMNSFNKLVLRARTASASTIKAKIVLTFADASSVSAMATLTDNFQDIQIPLSSFVADAALLLPRPYPDFLPLSFRGRNTGAIDLSEVEKVEITIASDLPAAELKRPYTLDVESIMLQK